MSDPPGNLTETATSGGEVRYVDFGNTCASFDPTDLSFPAPELWDDLPSNLTKADDLVSRLTATLDRDGLLAVAATDAHELVTVALAIYIACHEAYRHTQWSLAFKDTWVGSDRPGIKIRGIQHPGAGSTRPYGDNVSALQWWNDQSTGAQHTDANPTPRRTGLLGRQLRRCRPRRDLAPHRRRHAQGDLHEGERGAG